MSQTDRELARRFWSGTPLRALWPLLAGVFFMALMVRQGLRRVRTDAEMALAREIHVSLVPEVSLEAPPCEMYGRCLTT